MEFIFSGFSQLMVAAKMRYDVLNTYLTAGTGISAVQFGGTETGQAYNKCMESSPRLTTSMLTIPDETVQVGFRIANPNSRKIGCQVKRALGDFTILIPNQHLQLLNTAYQPLHFTIIPPLTPQPPLPPSPLSLPAVLTLLVMGTSMGTGTIPAYRHP